MEYPAYILLSLCDSSFVLNSVCLCVCVCEGVCAYVRVHIGYIYIYIFKRVVTVDTRRRLPQRQLIAVMSGSSHEMRIIFFFFFPLHCIDYSYVTFIDLQRS